MALNHRITSQILSQLDWHGGLTRDDIARMVQESDEMDASDLIRLYQSLPEGRRFFSLEEAVDAVDVKNWEA